MSKMTLADVGVSALLPPDLRKALMDCDNWPPAQRLARVDRLATFHQPVEADGEIHPIGRFRAACPELQRGLGVAGVFLAAIAFGGSLNHVRSLRVQIIQGGKRLDDMMGLGVQKPCSLTLEACGFAVTMRLCL